MPKSLVQTDLSPTPSAPSVRTFARGTVIVMAATFFGLGTNYLYGIYVARQLGPETFGLYAIGLSLFNLLTILAVMGLDSAVLHFVPGAWGHGHRRQAWSVLRATLTVGAGMGCLVGGVLWLLSGTLAHQVFSKSALGEVLPFFALAIPIYTLATIGLSGLQALHDVKWRMLVKYVSEPVVKFAVTALLISMGWALSGALAGLLVALMCSAVLGWFALQRHMTRNARTTPTGEDCALPAAKVVSYAMPLLGGIVFNAAASRSDILILGYLLPASEAGVYAAALQTAGIIAIVLQSVESIIAAPLSEALAHDRMTQAREIYRLSLRWAVMIGAPVVLVFVLWPAEILGVFGHSFRDGAAALTVLVLAQFVNLATGSANYVLLLSGRSRVVMFNEIVNGSLLMALNFLLIPRYGVTGAAMAFLLSLAAVNVLRLFQVQRHLDIQPYDWVLIKPLIAAGVGYLGALVATEWLQVVMPLWLMPLVVAVYVACLLALGLHEQDRLALASVLPGRWLRTENK